MSKKSDKAKLDVMWSKLVKLRAGNRCERCHNANPLNSHHIFSRRYLNVRYDLENGFCTCVKCHFFFHQNPTESSMWLIKKRGKDWHEKLLARKYVITKQDLGLIKFYLESELKKYE